MPMMNGEPSTDLWLVWLQHEVKFLVEKRAAVNQQDSTGTEGSHVSEELRQGVQLRHV